MMAKGMAPAMCLYCAAFYEPYICTMCYYMAKQTIIIKEQSHHESAVYESLNKAL